MPDFTPAISKGRLDTLRKIHLDDQRNNKKATLACLAFSTPGRKGYDTLLEVPLGWYLSSGKQIGEPTILQIAESETLTRQILDKTDAFGIYIPRISDPAKVWAIIGDDPRKAPLKVSTLIWSFYVTATQEPVG